MNRREFFCGAAAVSIIAAASVALAHQPAWLTERDVKLLKEVGNAGAQVVLKGHEGSWNLFSTRVLYGPGETETSNGRVIAVFRRPWNPSADSIEYAVAKDDFQWRLA